MMIKKFAAVMAAAVMAMASAPCAFADWGYDNGYDNGYNTYDNNTYDNGNTGYDNNGWTADNGADNGAVTTAPAGDGPAETSVETAGNVVTSMGATTTSDKPTSAPSRVYLQTSEIKDGIVTAELRIEADAVVSEALVSVTFDTNSLQLVGTAINEEAGGKAEETTFNGKYVLNYTNDLGSNFKGNYVTMTFKLLDPDLATTTLFLTVTNLSNKTGVPISYSVDNGIIQNPASPNFNAQTEPAAEERKNPKVTIKLSKGTAFPEELGLSDYRNIVVADTSVMSFEEGVFKFLKAGTTSFDVVFNNNDLKTYDVVIEDNTQETAQVQPGVIGTQQTQQTPGEKSNGGSAKKIFFVLLAVAAAIVVIFAEYLVIMKPLNKGGKRKNKLAEAEAFFENEAYADDEDEDMKADLQKAFAARDARRKAANADNEPEEISEIEYEEDVQPEEANEEADKEDITFEDEE